MKVTHDAKNPAATLPFGCMPLRLTLVVLAAAFAAALPLQSLRPNWPLAARVAMAAVVGGLAGVMVSLVAPFFVRRKPGRGCA